MSKTGEREKLGVVVQVSKLAGPPSRRPCWAGMGRRPSSRCPASGVYCSAQYPVRYSGASVGVFQRDKACLCHLLTGHLVILIHSKIAAVRGRSEKNQAGSSLLTLAQVVGMGTCWGPKRSVCGVCMIHVCCFSLALFVLDRGGESAILDPRHHPPPAPQ